MTNDEMIGKVCKLSEVPRGWVFQYLQYTHFTEEGIRLMVSNGNYFCALLNYPSGIENGHDGNIDVKIIKYDPRMLL